jgi:ribosome-binding protein aMBF1 (putative translation factor)
VKSAFLPLIDGTLPIFGGRGRGGFGPRIPPESARRNDRAPGSMKKEEKNRPSRRTASRVSLAENLRTARSLFGWSQEELAFQCGLKRTYIGALERTEINPGIDNVDRLAAGIGVLAHVLLMNPAAAYPELYAAARRPARRGQR